MRKPSANEPANLENYLGVFQYSRRAIGLVWSTHKQLTIALALLTLVAGILPAAVAFLGKLIVDAVVSAIGIYQGDGELVYGRVLIFVAVEGILVAAVAGAQRGIDFCQSLLRVLLSQRVNILIVEKALTLELAQFENSEFYDKLNRARREASSRPLSLVNRTFGLAQNSISLASFAGLLMQYSPWAVLVLVAAGLPAFLAETRFSGERFRVFHWRSVERRILNYLEIVLTREDHVKEVQLFRLGPELLRRYRDIFKRLYDEERQLTIRRDVWGFGLGLMGNLAFYGTYAWIAVSTIVGQITLGQMTMYLLVFKQGQSAVSAMLSAIGGMYEDNLYLSNLFAYLEQPVATWKGHALTGPDVGDGLRFERVSFTYPGAGSTAVKEVTLHIEPGESLAIVGLNGSGKTTLIKLLAGLYQPDSGQIRYQGLELSKWKPDALRRRIGVIFQDFNRYQLRVGENIGVGDVDMLNSEEKWEEAARKGKAADFVATLSAGYHTQLGRWFHDGQELSNGQWQRIALSRVFMPSEAEILVLDEPTASIDAETEAEIFDHFQSLTKDKMVVLISHRFSTVRRADTIAVLDKGRVIEKGSHEELMMFAGEYARLFELQAKGYR
ncbi:MAG: ABC transporter ATP-binding protein [Gammaproteobacteria bacterium]